MLAVRLEAVDVYLKQEQLLQGRDGTYLGLIKMNLAADYLNSAVEVSLHEPPSDTLTGCGSCSYRVGFSVPTNF